MPLAAEAAGELYGVPAACGGGRARPDGDPAGYLFLVCFSATTGITRTTATMRRRWCVPAASSTSSPSRGFDLALAHRGSWCYTAETDAWESLAAWKERNEVS